MKKRDDDLFETTARADDPFEGDLGRCLHRHLVALLEKRHGGGTTCPSEIARAAARELGCEWRDLMRPVRHVAEVLADRGQVEALQAGVAVNIREARGPIRLRLRLPRLA